MGSSKGVSELTGLSYGAEIVVYATGCFILLPFSCNNCFVCCLMFAIDAPWKLLLAARKVFESYLGSLYVGEKGSTLKISFLLIVLIALISGKIVLLVSIDNSAPYFLGDRGVGKLISISLSSTDITRSCLSNLEIDASSNCKDLSVRLLVSRNCETSSPIIDYTFAFIAGVFRASGMRA